MIFRLHHILGEVTFYHLKANMYGCAKTYS